MLLGFKCLSYLITCTEDMWLFCASLKFSFHYYSRKALWQYTVKEEHLEILCLLLYLKCLFFKCIRQYLWYFVPLDFKKVLNKVPPISHFFSETIKFRVGEGLAFWTNISNYVVIRAKITYLEALFNSWMGGTFRFLRTRQEPSSRMRTICWS